MINPLQAMQQARAGNQNRASAIQSTGAANQAQNLQRQQMNTGSIGTRMDGPAAQMLAVDPNLYADKKQQRDFTALNQERERQHASNLSQIQNQQALAREELRNQNNLALGKANSELQRQNSLEAEKRALTAQDNKRKSDLEQMQMKQILTDERFSDLREPAYRVMARKNAWASGAAQKFQQETYTQLLNNRAMAYGDTAISQEWADEQNRKDPNNTSKYGPDKIDRKSPEYLQAAQRLLQKDPKFAQIQGEVLKESQNRTYATGKGIEDAYLATIASTTKLGYSLRKPEGYTDPNFNPKVTTQFPGLLDPPMPPDLKKGPDNSNQPILFGRDPNGNLGFNGVIPEYASDLTEKVSLGNVVPAAIFGGAADQFSKGVNQRNAAKALDNMPKPQNTFAPGQNPNLQPQGSIRARYEARQRALIATNKTARRDFLKGVMEKHAPDLKLKDVDIDKMSDADFKKMVVGSQKGFISNLASKGIKGLKSPGAKMGNVGRGLGWLTAAILANDVYNSLSPVEQQEILEDAEDLNAVATMANESNETKQFEYEILKD